MVHQPPTIHPTAIVEKGAVIGDGTVIWHHSHVRAGAVIGAQESLGKNVYVDAGAMVGNGVRIQNNVSVYSGVTLGDSVFVGPSVVFTNDLRPRASSREFEVIGTNIAEGATLGANATIVCGANIAAWAFVAAGSVVTRDVEAHELVAGNPARRLGWVAKCGHTVAGPDEPPPVGGLELCLECEDVATQD